MVLPTSFRKIKEGIELRLYIKLLEKILFNDCSVYFTKDSVFCRPPIFIQH